MATPMAAPGVPSVHNVGILTDVPLDRVGEKVSYKERRAPFADGMDPPPQTGV